MINNILDFLHLSTLSYYYDNSRKLNNNKKFNGKNILNGIIYIYIYIYTFAFCVNLLP